MSVGTIGIGSVSYTHDGDTMAFCVDSVDHPISASPGTVPILEWGTEPIADAPRVVEQGARDELANGEGHRLR